MDKVDLVEGTVVEVVGHIVVVDHTAEVVVGHIAVGGDHTVEDDL